ncbi:hypothetical protein LCGC14_2725310 [marine sediment metagenome]|uniref:Uncharacterized protein n=1 Tax=marine sediment metagenome TaxID=412755 RepID=A0A0F9BHW9_9ZZZZ
MNLASYLKSKHLEYCNEIGDIVYESDWIKNVLNLRLPQGDKFSVASFNQWMNDDRSPDGKNIVRLITVFGFGVLPYLGVKHHGDLGDVVTTWDSLPEEEKKEIHGIIKKNSTALQP